MNWHVGLIPSKHTFLKWFALSISSRDRWSTGPFQGCERSDRQSWSHLPVVDQAGCPSPSALLTWKWSYLSFRLISSKIRQVYWCRLLSSWPVRNMPYRTNGAGWWWVLLAFHRQSLPCCRYACLWWLWPRYSPLCWRCKLTCHAGFCASLGHLKANSIQ